MKSVSLRFMLFYYAYNIKKTVLCNPIWAIKGNTCIIKRKMFKKGHFSYNFVEIAIQLYQ